MSSGAGQVSHAHPYSHPVIVCTVLSSPSPPASPCSSSNLPIHTLQFVATLSTFLHSKNTQPFMNIFLSSRSVIFHLKQDLQGRLPEPVRFICRSCNQQQNNTCFFHSLKLSRNLKMRRLLFNNFFVGQIYMNFLPFLRNYLHGKW